MTALRLLPIFALLLAPLASAQTLFTPPALPDASVYRSASGKPGPGYWQQSADYTIRATLDPAEHRISGSQTIRYTNNAPEALEYLWVSLEQNLFEPGSRGARLQPPDSRWQGAFDEGGYTLGRVEIVYEGQRYRPQFIVDDTRMRVDLRQPLAAGGGTLELDIDWSFLVPEYGADRMGRLAVQRGTVYTIAQWFPRMFVFDDVHGWNPMPYLGQGEFYHNFGQYDVEITVPHDFTVVATGVLQNPEQTYTAEQRQRLERARASETTVSIIGRDEVGTPASRPARTGTTTWRFRADDVRDFAWAASQAFILDASGYENTLTMAAYPHEGIGTPGNPGWEEAAHYTRFSIQHHSEMWFPYPYPVAISVAGVVRGMEYPMIHFSSVAARDMALFSVIDHELAHNWFPMIVASDERRWMWQDEGLTGFLNYFANLSFYGEGTGARWVALMASDYIAGMMQDPTQQLPIMTPADQIPAAALGFVAYRKPAKGLMMLRNAILGPERFETAFRAYIERWAFRHPQPADFFRTIEDVAGEQLGWFWRGWFFTTDVLDQRVERVEPRAGGTLITVAHREGLVMPVDLAITFADGAVVRERVPIEAFFNRSAFTVGIDDPRQVVRVEIDPDLHLPDVNRMDNVWRAAQ
jgi:hypothetical protein